MTSEVRKPTFFTSDLHIGHKSVLEFDRRPFRDLEHMHDVLISNYNATVPERGICYFLGDIGLGSSSLTREVVTQMNGVKVLVVGNHDRGYNSCYEMGFDVVMHGATIYLGENRITMSHCPLAGVFREDTNGMRNSTGDECWHGDIKNRKYSVADEGQFHLSGHIHSGPHNDKKRELGRQYDVGVAANNYTPVSISQIEKWIASVLSATGKVKTLI